LTAEQVARRQKVHDRIAYERPGVWRWTGQAKTARGAKYPQLVHSLGGGVTQLVNARHVIFYLATGWAPDDVQQYRAKDGDPLNVHPANLIPMPPVTRPRATNNFWDTARLRKYYG
jgi:hypothetical protein